MTQVSEKLKNVMDEEWVYQLQPFLDGPKMQVILDYLTSRKNKGAQILPAQKEIFNAFKYTPFKDVKVVILGQDPYHTPGRADGLAFSSKDSTVCPPSLKNIFKEIENDVYKGLNLNRSKDYSLKYLAEQGVLLLNTAFTVEAHQPLIHAELWEPFTEYVLHTLNVKREKLVFLMWGEKAQRCAELIDPTLHFILKTSHPSPFSANRGFLGCKHFSKTNQILKNYTNKSEIIW